LFKGKRVTIQCYLNKNLQTKRQPIRTVVTEMISENLIKGFLLQIFYLVKSFLKGHAQRTSIAFFMLTSTVIIMINICWPDWNPLVVVSIPRSAHLPRLLGHTKNRSLLNRVLSTREYVVLVAERAVRFLFSLGCYNVPRFPVPVHIIYPTDTVHCVVWLDLGGLRYILVVYQNLLLLGIPFKFSLSIALRK